MVPVLPSAAAASQLFSDGAAGQGAHEYDLAVCTLVARLRQLVEQGPSGSPARNRNQSASQQPPHNTPTTVRCRHPTGRGAHFTQVPGHMAVQQVLAAVQVCNIPPPLRSLVLLHTPGCISPGLIARGLASLALQGCERVNLAVLDRGDIIAQPGDTLVGESERILLQVLGLGEGRQGHRHNRTQRATLFATPQPQVLGGSK